MDQVDKAALGAFLRRRREGVRPQDVGLEDSGRRRTPGLRRQEVAQLAGISVEYLIRLEQGRGPRPSGQVITALGRALRMSEDERDHLARLAGVAPRPAGWMRQDVRPGLLHVLEQLRDSPAMVCDVVYNVLAWNPVAAALLPDLLAWPDGERNVIKRFFLQRDRSRPQDGASDTFGPELVAGLRVAASRYRDDHRVQQLITELRASAEFTELWDAQSVDVTPSATKRIEHPEIGTIELDCEALHDPSRDQWLIIYTARPGTPGHEALRLLSVIGTEDMRSRQSVYPSASGREEFPEPPLDQ